jgi:hypothetical protein
MQPVNVQELIRQHRIVFPFDAKTVGNTYGDWFKLITLPTDEHIVDAMIRDSHGAIMRGALLVYKSHAPNLLHACGIVRDITKISADDLHTEIMVVFDYLDNENGRVMSRVHENLIMSCTYSVDSYHGQPGMTHSLFRDFTLTANHLIR